MIANDRVWVTVSRDRERLGSVNKVNDNLIEVLLDNGTLLCTQIDKVRPANGEDKESEVAIKNDNKKVRLELIPHEGLYAIGQAFTFGAKKYADHNWANGFKWGRLLGASLRHIVSYMGGEDKDPESGLSHLAHAGACICILIAHEKKGLGQDDRRKG